MRFWIKLLLIVVIFGCCVVIAARVDPKLDFTEVAARVVEQKDSKEEKTPQSNVRGVRVTVETKSDVKGSPESKSSESSDSSSSGDRTSSGSVGVRTDVTFEISNETNETRSEEETGGNNKKKPGIKGDKDKKNDEDYDDIPVIKGRTSPPKKESNDITTWRPMVRPIFPKSDSRGDHGHIPWTKSFPSSGVWTTERNYFGLYDNYSPSQPMGTHIPPHQQQHHHQNPPQVQFYPYIIGQPTWQACRCDLLRPESNSWSPSSPGKNQNTNQYHYTVIDDKLDEPFSVSKRNSPRRRESFRS